MRILVTGGAGYIGAVLVPILLAEGHEVRVLDHLRRGGHGLLGCCASPRFELIRRDITDEEAMTIALDGVGAVVHLAAIVGQGPCDREPGCAWTTNVDGTRALVALRSRDQRLLFASTGSVYGAVKDTVCTETTAVDPLTLYARSKAVGEQIALEGGNAVVFRFATGYGVSRSMRLDLLLNDFVYQAVRRGNLVVYEPDARRTLIHVRDMARSIAFALREWSGLADDVYNVGNESLNLSKAQIVDCIRQRIPCYIHLAEFASDPDRRDYAVSYQKIRAKGFHPELDLESGIAELLQAVRLIDQ